MASDPEIPFIDVRPPTEAARRLWRKTLELARVFGSDEPWCLIGGLMVQLHAFERGGSVRPTADIDLLGDSRRRPSMTWRMAAILDKRGGRMAVPPFADAKLGLRFDLDGEIVEVLGSEGVPEDPRTMGRHTTFQVPGGTQALRRTEKVAVSLEDSPAVTLRRPTLLGAILIKARALGRRRGPKLESDRQDLILLLTFVKDPRALASDGEMKKSEKAWLRRVENQLDFADSQLLERLPGESIVRAEQAYRLLTA